MQDWNGNGDPKLAGYTGRVSFARTFTLTEAQARQDATLSLGIIYEKDLTWVNGTLVGATDSWSEGQRYAVAKQSLRSGHNTIITLAENGYGAGGMMGPNEEAYLSFVAGPPIDLNGNWRYKIAKKHGPAPWVDDRGRADGTPIITTASPKVRLVLTGPRQGLIR
ncbi:hypothetical protein GCM10009069_28250 [Algimonas arctica]|uniref:Uncharacterized protein n=1 Tax=Algimonas arctica TaxID=1479486 RepID=A0A8J3CSN6_9PROT|nr:hypothetical protein [Algimonas arctica]GHB04003.1 hypothetical protein GCM10009069_28250 [Algimonas arctica]